MSQFDDAASASSTTSALVSWLEDVTQNKSLATLQLEYKAITSLEPLLPALSKLKNLGELSLSGNSISELPTDLSSLSMLTVLDLTNNPLRDLQSVLSALSTLPSLAVLRIDLSSVADVRRVKHELPFLQVLNGSPTGTDDADESEIAAAESKAASRADAPQSVQEEAASTDFHARRVPERPESNHAEPGHHGITKDALTDVARVYGAIEQISQARIADHDESQFVEDFDRHVTNTLDALGAKKAQNRRNPALGDVFVRTAQRKLYEICGQKILQYVEQTTGDDELSNVLRLLFESQERVALAADAATAELAVHADRSERELEQVLQTAEMLEQQVDVETMKNKILTEAFDKERDRLIRRAAQAAATSSNARSPRSSRQAIVPTEDFSSSLSLVSSPESRPRNAGRKSSSETGNGADNVRDMTLKQLLDTIQALYDSKTEFDRKCEEARQPKETMQQHLVTYLRKQYGLPSLLESHALSIMKATKKYARRNNDVMVFQKIIDNEFEEDFRFVQASLKKSVKGLLRAYLRSAHKRKSTAFVDNLLKKRTSKTGMIYEKEWTDILKYMYNVEDAMNLTCMLKEMADQQEAETANNRKLERGQPRRLLRAPKSEDTNKYAIRYLDFEQVLLNFQLKGHEKFLRQFCQVFREFDPQSKGLLDEKDMRLLVLKINPNKTHDELDHLVATVDPYNHQLITFSQVAFFAPLLSRRRCVHSLFHSRLQVVNVLQDEIEILASGLHPTFPGSDIN